MSTGIESITLFVVLNNNEEKQSFNWIRSVIALHHGLRFLPNPHTEGRREIDCER